MFDLVVVDEAHHLPSRTWRGVLDHLEAPYVLLLTATPFRLDRKPVPGTRTFFFPLRQAIAEGFYKPIRPPILPRPEPYDIRARDNTIAAGGAMPHSHGHASAHQHGDLIARLVGLANLNLRRRVRPRPVGALGNDRLVVRGFLELAVLDRVPRRWLP